MAVPCLSPQIFLYANAVPSGGDTTVAPLTGTALLTNFTLSSSGWTDPEADLPLTYAFYLQAAIPREDAEPVVTTTLLRQPERASTCRVSREL